MRAEIDILRDFSKIINSLNLGPPKNTQKQLQKHLKSTNKPQEIMKFVLLLFEFVDDNPYAKKQSEINEYAHVCPLLDRNDP